MAFSGTLSTFGVFCRRLSIFCGADRAVAISGAAYGAVSMQWLLPPSPRGGTLTPAALTRQRAGECPLQPLSKAGLHAGGSEAKVGRLGKGGFGGLGLAKKKVLLLVRSTHRGDEAVHLVSA